MEALARLLLTAVVVAAICCGQARASGGRELLVPPVYASTGLVPPDGSTAGTSRFFYVRSFRYQALGGRGTPANPTWAVKPTVDWRTTGRVPPVAVQGHCPGSWALAAAAALESAWAIADGAPGAVGGPTHGATPLISSMQLADCSPGNGSCVHGGWPLDALDYVAAAPGGRLYSAAQYPFVGITPHKHRCAQTALGALTLKETSYEGASFFGVLGLLLALANQPVIALVAGEQKSFASYNGSSVYADPNCFAGGIVNQAVLVIGYNLEASVPYLIIQNSWGAGWGADGYMKMAIQGGPGVCGINTSPVYYPIVRGPSACGPPNPCGSGRCVARSGGGSVCRCPSGFAPVANVDGTQSCVLVHVCSALQANPCGFGTCVEDGRGSYACICPLGFETVQNDDLSSTCVIVEDTTNLRNVKYVATGLENCYLVAVTFGLTVPQLQILNTGVKCGNGNGKVPAGTTLNVTNTDIKGCASYYPVSSQGDTCRSVALQLGLTLAALLDLNPGLNCDRLAAGMQLCIARSTACTSPPCGGRYLEFCTQQLAPGPRDTCLSIMTRYKLNTSELYTLNPGLYCGHLLPNVSSNARVGAKALHVPGSPVCVGGSFYPLCTIGDICYLHPCPPASRSLPPSQTFQVRRGQSCQSIVYHECRNSFRLFRALNRQLLCGNGRPYINQLVCVPSRR